MHRSSGECPKKWISSYMKLFVSAAVLAVAVGTFAPQAALATNGYFSLGYGLKAQGMGGAAAALTNDAKGGANNPASMAWAGNRFDVGFEEFNPTRSASRTGNANGLNASVASEQNSFVIPGVGYNRMLSSGSAIGVTVYGNGGLNTDYGSGQLNCGGGLGREICSAAPVASASTSFSSSSRRRSRSKSAAAPRSASRRCWSIKPFARADCKRSPPSLRRRAPSPITVRRHRTGSASASDFSASFRTASTSARRSLRASI